MALKLAHDSMLVGSSVDSHDIIDGLVQVVVLMNVDNPTQLHLSTL
jgi:hypothetical protein